MFEQQDCESTLEEGLAEYYADNAGLLDTRSLSPAAVEFFRCHDAAHVVFGCGTSLPHEAFVKICSIWGTTAGLSVLSGYGLHEARQIYRRLTVAEVLRGLAGSTVLVPRAIGCCLRQRERWPWRDFQGFRHVPLVQIRRRFGIRVPGDWT